MTFDPKQELAGLQAEEVQLAKNYKEAETVLTNITNRLLVIKGAKEMLQKQIQPEPAVEAEQVKDEKKGK